MSANRTYLTTEQLAERIHYDARPIRPMLLDAYLFEGRLCGIQEDKTNTDAVRT